MTTTYTWTTPRGAKVEMTVSVNHITRKTVNADGNEILVGCDCWTRKVDSMMVNGKSTAMSELASVSGRDAVIIGRQGNAPVAVALPENVVMAIYGEEREANAKRLAAEVEAEKAHDAKVSAIRALMGE